ncbi:MAG: S41 family peptidase [Patescibacteria group bacterium]
MEPRNTRILTIVVLVALVVGFGSGFWFANYRVTDGEFGLQTLFNKEYGQPKNIDFGLFWQVWDSLNKKYVEKGDISMQKMVYGAISGMVNSIGDPYTVFFEPKLSKKFQEEISGSFSGVGMEIGKRNNMLTVIAPIKDTPAYRAGIQSGDVILKIDDKSTENLTVEEAVGFIRGPRGTRVTITIVRNGDDISRDVTLTREVIKVPAVTWKMMDGHIAYVDITTFNQNVDTEFEKAAKEILRSSADRIIVDLRNNPGGLLDSAIELSGWFLDHNSLVTTEVFGDGERNEFRTTGDAELKKYPTVILINDGSASASEILAGALHDNRAVKLIGEKTFGKGSVQELEKFSDGSSLKVTIAKWLTPAGVSISEKGIVPDVEITIDPKATDADTIVIGESGKDPQLDKAIEVVNDL